MKDEEYVALGVLTVNLTDDSVSVQIEVYEGMSVWFSSRDKEKIVSGLDRMAAQIKEHIDRHLYTSVVLCPKLTMKGVVLG